MENTNEIPEDQLLDGDIGLNSDEDSEVKGFESSSETELNQSEDVRIYEESEDESDDSYDSFDDEESVDENQSETISFEDLGLDEITLKAIQKKGFVSPSPIQVLAIPRLLNGDANVIARARTGTGKTAAFGLPLVQSLRSESDCVKAIILEPTRELAMQTCTEMASFTSGRFPRTCVVYGGASMGEQIRQLKRGEEIVVGTPGRVQDLMERGLLDISKIEYFILDEGDEMLDMGFVDDIENIFSKANPECRVLLFSATIPAPILKIAQKFMGEYEIVEEEGVVEEPLLIDQKYWLVRESDKVEALVRLIDISDDFYGLVFVQKKTDADYVSKALDEKGYEAAALHGDIPQGQREKILARFRSGKTRILVATDVAARGIDIEGLTHVVNYEMPFDGPTYVHRIGRTGRAGSSGIAVTLVRPEERRRLSYLRSAIMKQAKGEMEEAKVPSVEEVINAKRERLFKKIKDSLESQIKVDGESENPSSFVELAKDLCQDKNGEEVVSSLLNMIYGQELNHKRYNKITPCEKGRGGRERDRGSRDRGRGGRERPAAFVRDDQLRLYVQMGWHDGYNPKKIAAYLSELLKIKNKDVDAIDMADKFCLLNLPQEAAKRALALSEGSSKIPHMHLDTRASKSSFGEGRGSRERGERNRSRGAGRERESFRGRDRSSRGKNSSHARAGVHTATRRSGQAALYKKSSNAEEY